MGKTSRCHNKNTISMGKTCRYLKRDIWEKQLMSYKNTIYMWKRSRCHIKTRYLWDKPLMSYKNTISMGKTSRCPYKNTISMGKQVDVI